jgi:hypothetical protein
VHTDFMKGAFGKFILRDVKSEDLIVKLELTED